MPINNVASKLNELSENFKIGALQNLRKSLKGLSRVPTNNIFSGKSIDVNGAWAFHLGGRKEMQFNIGFEDNTMLRYGVAFSLEPGRDLPNPVGELEPKIMLFNDYLKANPNRFEGYSMWYFYDEDRSVNYPLGLIPHEWIKNGSFIFIGKFIEKTPDEIGNEDILEALKTFDDLLDLYEYIESTSQPTSINVVEEKIARICWNDFKWQRPSGKESKSKNEDSHEAREGYGHEEWLLDLHKLIDGYHYGFVQCFNNKKDFSGNRFNLSLFTINGKTRERFWIGEIKSLEVISKDISVKISKEYEIRGWKEEMASQLIAVKIDPTTFIKTPDEIFVNVRFKQENLNLLEEPLQFSNKDQAVASTYYSTLLNKKHEPMLQLPFLEPFTFVPGHTEGKEATSAEYGKRTGDIDLAHNRMQTNIYKQLVEKFDLEKVGTEQNSIGGTKIDLVLKMDDGFWFYEFKTSNSIKACIREALPQLLEYAYWHKTDNVARLIIASHNHITPEAENYLDLLRSRFNINIYYQRYNPELLKLEEKIY